jgi:hypothetical protein
VAAAAPSAAGPGGSPAGHDPAGFLAFKDRLMAARRRLLQGGLQLSAPAQQLLRALVFYRDQLLPLAADPARQEGAGYMAARCGSALELMLAEGQALGQEGAELELEDLGISALMAGLPAFG